jgi:hypothetical protein
MIKRQMFGRAGLPLLRKRMAAHHPELADAGCLLPLRAGFCRLT